MQTIDTPKGILNFSIIDASSAKTFANAEFIKPGFVNVKSDVRWAPSSSRIKRRPTRIAAMGKKRIELK